MEELIKKAQNGDKDAFTSIILDMNDELYKIARTRLNNENDIFDAIQETMISSYKSIKKLKDPKCFKSWLIKILINKCNDIYKKKKIISIEQNNLQDYLQDETELDNNLNFLSIIKHLNYNERIAILLYYQNQFTTKEIANILHTNENTIKTRIARAKNKIKNNYKMEV